MLSRCTQPIANSNPPAADQSAVLCLLYCVNSPFNVLYLQVRRDSIADFGVATVEHLQYERQRLGHIYLLLSWLVVSIRYKLQGEC